MENILPHLAPGAIILMHDGVEGTVQYLPALIDAIRAQGYAFATIPMILGGPKNIHPERIYHHG